MLDTLIERVRAIFELGGPVVMVLVAASILTLAVVLYKIWQFSVARVGNHAALRAAVAAWDHGDRAVARSELERSKSYLAPVVAAAFDSKREDKDRLLAMAEERFARLEKGFRFLDTIAQLAPLLGLFGTVLGMIAAFQSMQSAGAQVDPSVLAGGIWVALLTTAVGLVVAMPTAAVLTWLESRMENERVVADSFVLTVLSPTGQAPRADDAPGLAPIHG